MNPRLNPYKKNKYQVVCNSCDREVNATYYRELCSSDCIDKLLRDMLKEKVEYYGFIPKPKPPKCVRKWEKKLKKLEKSKSL